MTRAGGYDKRVAWDEPILNDAGEGIGFVETFRTWSRIKPLGGRETLRSGTQILADLDTLITVRWSPMTQRINETWRARYKNTIYNISGKPVDIDMKHCEIEVPCKSGLNQG